MKTCTLGVWTSTLGVRASGGRLGRGAGGRAGGRKDRWTDGRTEGWMGGRADGQADARTEEHFPLMDTVTAGLSLLQIHSSNNMDHIGNKISKRRYKYQQRLKLNKQTTIHASERK